MKDPVIVLKDLTKRYARQTAVDSLHLTVHRGEIFGLLGPNGAGKTTTILMLLGLTEPTAGYAEVCGIDATRNPIDVKRKVGYLPDNVGFYDYMSGLENLVLIGRLNGLDAAAAQEKANALLEDVGLGDNKSKKTGAYSRGMKQRLGLAEVLIKDPEVIILDEPTLGIDPSGVRDFLTLIQSLSKQQNITVLLSSHHLHHVQQVCDRVGLFVDGKLLANGTIDSLAKILFDEDGHVTTVTIQQKAGEDGSRIVALLQQVPHVTRVTVEGNQLTVKATENNTALVVNELVRAGQAIEEVRKKTYGLDDIYQRYFEHREEPIS